MRASSVVGRVGALAVAIGVGAAVGTGAAWADPPKPGPTSSDSPNPGGTSKDAASKTGQKKGLKLPKKAATKAHAADQDRPGKRRAAKDGVSTPPAPSDPADPTEVTPPVEVTPAVVPVTPDKPRVTKPKPKAKATLAPTRKIAIGKPAQARVTQVSAGGTAPAVIEKDPPVTVTLDVTQQMSKSFSLAPVVTPAQETVKAKPSLSKLVSGVLGALGWNPTTSAKSPSAPIGVGALVMGLVGWGSRRESEEALKQVPPSSPINTELTVAPLAAVASQATTMVGWVTGTRTNRDGYDNNNTSGRFGIGGTDLGIMWDNGVGGDNPNTAIVEQHQVLIAFGDTFTDAPSGAGWRSNVLLRSADRVLSDGIKVPDGIVDPLTIPAGAYSGSPMSTDPRQPNYSRELIGKYPYSTATQVTTIPTGAISVPGAGANGATRQYIAYMSIKQWGVPGSWTTNYAAIAYSDDNGQNWRNVPQSSVRSAGQGRSTVPYVAGNDHFQMVSFVKPPEGSADAAAGYIYATGTPSGRSGQVYLSRVKQADILDVAKYEYWDGKKWVVNQPSAATPILPKTVGLFGIARKTTAGELSLQYNTYLDKYVILYTDKGNNVVLRTADSLNGTWSDGTKLVTPTGQYAGLYAPMIHPWSGTDQLLKEDGSVEDPQYLYWNMSLWNDYNVALMKTDLSQLGLMTGVAV